MFPNFWLGPKVSDSQVFLIRCGLSRVGRKSWLTNFRTFFWNKDLVVFNAQCTSSSTCHDVSRQIFIFSIKECGYMCICMDNCMQNIYVYILTCICASTYTAVQDLMPRHDYICLSCLPESKVRRSALLCSQRLSVPSLARLSSSRYTYLKLELPVARCFGVFHPSVQFTLYLL